MEPIASGDLHKQRMSSALGTKLPLDESLYDLKDDELAFFKALTGISDDDALKKHIIHVQTKAYEICGYPCIRRLAFTKLKICRLPAYADVLKLGRERKGAILLDMACCFGNDARKAVADGFPIQNVIASDLRHEFWDFGHGLFRTTPRSYPVTFIAGDAFDPSFIAPSSPYFQVPKTSHPPLPSLTSLTPLQGHVSAIFSASFFHLFDEEGQYKLALILASLLSPIPGSVMFGSQVGLIEKGFTIDDSTEGFTLFCHSPESWKALWTEIFKGTARVEASLKQADIGAWKGRQESPVSLLIWSVTRL